MSGLLDIIARQLVYKTVQILPLTSPGAGADPVFLPRSGEDWHILGYTATLTTSATVANRGVSFVIDDATSIAAEVSAGAVQVASTVQTYSFTEMTQSTVAVANAAVQTMALAQCVLPSGWRYRTITNNIQAGDQWGAITVWFLRMDEPPYVPFEVGTEADQEFDAQIAAYTGGTQ